jgi:hypothetical protein
MKKILTKIIKGCIQCDHKKYLGWGNYVCNHPKTKSMPLNMREEIPEKCPLENMYEEELVEPGC